MVEQKNLKMLWGILENGNNLKYVVKIIEVYGMVLKRYGHKMSAPTSLQFPTTQNISMLTGSLAIRLIWSLVGLLMGLSAGWFGLLGRPPLDQEKDFLALEAEGFFFCVTAGFFSLIILIMGWVDAAVVNIFLAVVEGACVVWRMEWPIGVVRGTLCVLLLYGLMRRVV